MMNQKNTRKAQSQAGFSLIELLVYMAILGLLMTLVMISFTQTMRRSGQQSSIAETTIEASIGLGMLRIDLEHAGFGLPWEWQDDGNMSYTEPEPFSGDSDEVPRALSSENLSNGSLNRADYLVVRGTNVARGEASQRWGYVGRDGLRNIQLRAIGEGGFTATDRLLVIRPQTETGELRQLLMDGDDYFFTTGTIHKVAPEPSTIDPDGAKFLVYGFNDDADISRPFNRVDYFVSAANVPTQCAPNTGVLGKRQINQADGGGVFMPIVDCVADFQIVYYMDTDGDGGWDEAFNADNISGLSAAQVRDQVKAIRCFILTHEGAFDTGYTHPNNEITVGDTINNKSVGRTFDLAERIKGNWANYRWKVHSVTVSPKNFH
ncbi:MAG: prepilin-type N-terminal cleavage/methylation domain-containing protein [bacterium]|nr:prepilin-type N-terminal cleavage/methylation domain-containing protein [bacterium]